MTSDEQRSGSGEGALSPAEGAGTPTAVDLSKDRRLRWMWVIFLAGPVIWFSHFMLVYLVAEAGCTGGGPGLRAFDPPVPVAFTLVSTAVAVPLCAVAAIWAFRHWRDSSREGELAVDDVSELSGELDDDRRRGSLAFAGFILSALSVVAVLFTGAPALVLGPC